MLVLSAWPPWITKNYAEKAVSDKFNKEWDGVDDGCSLTNLISSQRTFFGYKVSIEFTCGGALKEKTPVQRELFVSFIGLVHGSVK
ncbi:MAG: hypothetical protein AABX30_03015 [Nanoarchaeota archaeon]